VNPPNTYDAVTLDQIAVLWAAQLTTAQIGVRLHIPKNSICRLARTARLRGDSRFPARGFVNRRKSDPQPEPEIVSLPPRAPRRYVMVGRREVRLPPVALHNPPRIYELGPHACKYPIAEPAPRDHRFCAKPQYPGSAYCPEHDDLCRSLLYKARLR
jgi:hypothetical protein